MSKITQIVCLFCQNETAKPTLRHQHQNMLTCPHCEALYWLHPAWDLDTAHEHAVLRINGPTKKLALFQNISRRLVRYYRRHEGTEFALIFCKYT